MPKLLDRLVRKAFNLVGIDILRLSKSPRYSLLGLRNLPIRTIIDVGANTGQFASMILDVYPEAHIYSFEPLPKPFNELEKWAVRQNGRITVFNLALGDEEGEVEMFNHSEHSGSSSFLKTTHICETLYPFTKEQTTTMVKLTRLDKALADYIPNLTPDILVKLDVQGFEDRVIRGGTEVFHKSKACILEVCFNGLYENQTTFKHILNLLDSLGYYYAGNLNQVYADDGHVISIDAGFVK